ncbi:MAG: hypothetical protein GTO16_08805 [Candidatus Aminicenantes bacterium]|nr:hypothetical protein [Candidatus Aminicenantes bacterium]
MTFNQYEFWGDMDKAIEKWKKYLEERERTPEKFPKYIFLPHGVGEFSKGISIIEHDKDEQLLNHITFLWPEIKVKAEPAIDLSKGIEIYLQSKQRVEEKEKL